MRPPAATIVQNVGTLEPVHDTIDMGIDKANIEHILMLLTDLYSNKYEALCREYATNGFDAHQMIGQKRPIEITLPDAWSPFLVVRDFGPGMSFDLMTRTYSQYGSSTKRDENVSTGMFGIGGKSALTYNNSFTVTSFHNGERIIVEVSRAGSKATMKVLDRRNSSEPNGVEVRIPVKPGDQREFSQAARHFFSFWKEGTVLVNGNYPDRISLDHVVGNVYTSNDVTQDYVVMGNVPYAVGKRLYRASRPYNSSFNIIAFVNVGDVDIPPARETLQFTPKTDAVCDQIEADFTAHIRKMIVSQIDAAPNHSKAYAVAESLRAKYGTLMPSPVQYKGVDIPGKIDVQHAAWNTRSYRFAYTNGNKEINTDSLVNRTLVITNFTGLSTLNKVYKDKINQWKTKNNLNSITYHAFVTGGFVEPWIDKGRVVDWSTIKAEVLPSSHPSGGPRKKPTINVFDASGYTKPVTDLDPNKIPCYISPTARTGASEAKALYAAMPNYQIVELGENRWDKFKREYPNAVPLRSAVAQAYSTARDALTEDDVKVLGMDRSYYAEARLRNLDASEVLDPMLKQGIEFANGTYKSATLTQYRLIEQTAKRYANISLRSFSPYDPTRGYPLLSSVGSDTLSKKHAIMYVNAVYNNNNETV